MNEKMRLDPHDELRVLRAAHRGAQLLAQTSKLEEATHGLIGEFLELADADEGSIQLLRPKSERTRKTLARRGVSNKSPLEGRLDDWLTGSVLKRGRALRSDQPAELMGGVQSRTLWGEIGSVLAVPLVVRDKVIGSVNLVRFNEREAFAAEDEARSRALAESIAGLIETTDLREKIFDENERLHTELSVQFGRGGIIGRSAAMREVFRIVERVLPSDGRVLIEGESGTGKERIARLLHYEGPRKRAAFVAVDCGALPSNLLESELFGYVKGAFTGADRDRPGLFEAANGGTLFLDEIANTSPEIQSKLLRVLQEEEVRPLGSNQPRKVDVRIIAAASSDLKAKLDAGEFRSDLYYRLNVIPLRLPSLHERREDIPVLASSFLGRFSDRHRKNLRRLSREGEKVLEDYRWPGNVRELENVIERAVILAAEEDRTLTPEHLPFELSLRGAVEAVQEVPLSGHLPSLLAGYERQILEKVLRHHEWNQSEAARALDISERMVRYKMKKLGIQPPR